MKLMFFPVTMIEEFPHVLIYYNFTRKKDRYFLSPYEVEISSHGSQRTVCDIIRSSDFLCGLLNIDRAMILKQMSNNIPSTGSTTTTVDNSPSPNLEDKSSRRALSCSSSPTNTNSNDLLLTMIEQKLDFKHRCMFYSTGPTSDLCGMKIELKFHSMFFLFCLFVVCALDVDYNSSIVCNDIGYSNVTNSDEIKTGNNDDENSNSKGSPTKSLHKMRHQHRQYVHQWICIRDIIDGLITCNHTLKTKNIVEVLSKMDLWIKQRNEPKVIKSQSTLIDIKLGKARARQLIWDLMEIKYDENSHSEFFIIFVFL